MFGINSDSAIFKLIFMLLYPPVCVWIFQSRENCDVTEPPTPTTMNEKALGGRRWDQTHANNRSSPEIIALPGIVASTNDIISIQL